jgi:His/Glu/Gln/Arg/opine family amino acid ABC transporter permease subunit
MRGLDVKFMLECLPVILQGVPYTLKIAVVSMIFGTIIGLIAALARMYKVKVLNQLCSAYIAVIRGTPLMIQILVAYYGIPRILEYVNYKCGTNVNINSVPAIYFMYFCFSVYIGSYLAELIRASIQAVDKGQMEACYAMGMTTSQGMIRAVLPQAMTSALPNFGNTFIGQLKDASLAFAVAIPEMLGQAKILAARSSKFLEAYLAAAIFYFAICLICQQLLKVAEAYSRRNERK